MSKTYWSQRIEELANSEKAVPDTAFHIGSVPQLHRNRSKGYDYRCLRISEKMRIQHFRDGRRQTRQCVGG